MATISLTIPVGTNTTQCQTALCNWANLPDTPANAKQAIIIFVKQVTASFQAQATRDAVEAAQVQAAIDAVNNISIT